MAYIRNVHLEGARWKNCEHKALFEKTTSRKIEKIVLSRGFHAIFGDFLFSRGGAEESDFRIELSKRHITVITEQGTRTASLAELELPEKRKAKLQRRTRAVIDTAQRIHDRCVHTHYQGTESLSEGSTTDDVLQEKFEHSQDTQRTAAEALTERDITIQSLRDELDKLRATLKASEQQMLALSEEKEQLFRKASVAEVQVLSALPFLSSHDKLEKALHEARGQLEAQSSALAGLQQAYDALTARAHAATERTQQLETELAAARETNAALQSDLAGSRAESATSGEALQAAQTALEEQRQINATLRLQADRVPRLEAELTAAQRELQSTLTLKTHTANALALSEKATAVAKERAERIAALERELSSVKGERDKIQSQLDRFSGLGEHSISRLTQANQALTREKETLLAKQQATDKALLHAQRQAETANESREELRKAKENTDRRNQTLYEQLEGLKQRVEGLQQHEKTLSAQLAKNREELAQSQRENNAIVEDSRGTIHELLGKGAASEAQIRDLEEKLRRTQDRTQSAENQLATAKKDEETHANAKKVWQATSQQLVTTRQEMDRLNKELQKQTGREALQIEQIQDLKAQLDATSAENKRLLSQIQRLQHIPPAEIFPTRTPTGSAESSAPSTEAAGTQYSLADIAVPRQPPVPELNLSATPVRAAATTETTEDPQLEQLAALAKAARSQAAAQTTLTKGGEPDPYLLNEALSKLSVEYLGGRSREVNGDASGPPFKQSIDVCFYNDQGSPVYEYGSLNRRTMKAPAKVTKTGQFTEEANLFMCGVSPSLADTLSPPGVRRAGALTRALDKVSKEIVTTETSRSRSVANLMGVVTTSCLAQGKLPSNARQFRHFIQQNPMKVILHIEAAAKNHPKDANLQKLYTRAQKIRSALQGLGTSPQSSP